MKKVIEGWVGKTRKVKDIIEMQFDEDGEFDGVMIWYGKERKKKSGWWDWPPKKVKITIEVDCEYYGDVKEKEIPEVKSYPNPYGDDWDIEVED